MSNTACSSPCEVGRLWSSTLPGDSLLALCRSAITTTLPVGLNLSVSLKLLEGCELFPPRPPSCTTVLRPEVSIITVGPSSAPLPSSADA